MLACVCGGLLCIPTAVVALGVGLFGWVVNKFRKFVLKKGCDCECHTE